MNENTREKAEALRTKLSEDYSVAQIDDMDKVYKATIRAMTDIKDAIVLAQGLSLDDQMPDTGGQIRVALQHLRKASNEVEIAMKSMIPDVEGWAAWRDSTV